MIRVKCLVCGMYMKERQISYVNGKYAPIYRCKCGNKIRIIGVEINGTESKEDATRSDTANEGQ